MIILKCQENSENNLIAAYIIKKGGIFMSSKFLKRCGITALVLILFVAMSAVLPSRSFTVKGATFQPGTGTLESGQTVEGTVVFSGSVIQIDGTVEGTAFAFGQDVRVNGTINGDLVVAAQTVQINGQVNGNIYAAGQDLSLGTKNSGDAFLAGQNVRITKDSVMGRDLFAAGANITHDGTVQRRFSASGSVVDIGGTIGQDAVLDADNISILSGSSIKGNLDYTSPNKANIDSGSTIGGNTNWEYRKPAESTQTTVMDSWMSILLSIVSALIIWLIVRFWRPEFWNRNSKAIIEKPFKTLGAGALALIVIPIAAILLLVTVVGIPVGIILGIAYGVAIYLSKIVVASAFGYWTAKKYRWAQIHKGVWPVLAALIVLVVLTHVPYVDVLSGLLITLAGLGALVLTNMHAEKPEGNKEIQENINYEI
jgi:cytoskeletal protein CcmA (bactofilin family)